MTTTQGIEFLGNSLMPTAILAIPEALEPNVPYEFSINDAGLLTPVRAAMAGEYHTEMIGGAARVVVTHNLGNPWVRTSFWLVNPQDGMFKEYSPVACGPVDEAGTPSPNAIAVDFGGIVPRAGSIRVLVTSMAMPTGAAAPETTTPGTTPTAIPAPPTGEPVVGTATPNTLSAANSNRTYTFNYDLTGLPPGGNGFISGLLVSTSNNFANRAANFNYTSTPAQVSGYIPVNGVVGTITVTLPADWTPGDYKLGFTQNPSPDGAVLGSIPFRVTA